MVWCGGEQGWVLCAWFSFCVRGSFPVCCCCWLLAAGLSWCECQLSRAVETRSTSKRPQLSDLRESGAIEQDADIVSFIYRPEYYGIEEWEDGEASSNQAEIIIAKHRNGSLDDVRLRFIGELAKFSDLDQGSTMIMESKMNEGSSSGTGGFKKDDGGYTNLPTPSLDGGDVPF